MPTLIEHFADLIIASQQTYQPLDRRYLINVIYQQVGSTPKSANWPTTLIATARQLVRYAVTNRMIENRLAAKERLLAQLTDLYTPTPARVNQQFWNQYQFSPQAATDYFYQLSQANDYIKMAAIQKNIQFQTASPYGRLEITINLSKPEKDPRAIAQAQKVAQNYPHDALSFENEGFAGDAQHAPRRNHRLVRLTLGGQTFGLQYSPYAYFEQHCILLSQAEQVMHIDALTFHNLLDAVDLFPHYFFGSNADLPIVGGSILAHDHYQGGQHVFAMDRAPIVQKVTLGRFPDVQAGILQWPVSTLRLQSTNKQHLVQAAELILACWQRYSDPQVGIVAQSDGQQHHTLTPIARKQGSTYELDLALRDNQTSKQFPDGIFHPHPELHHIKKENIGLIEVMGLAILPPRLVPELTAVKQFLLGQKVKVNPIHQPWVQQIQQKHQVTVANVDATLQTELGQVFQQVLEDVGVFKQNAIGQAAWQRFIAAINVFASKD